jgi:hypothetical protein
MFALVMDTASTQIHVLATLDMVVQSVNCLCVTVSHRTTRLFVALMEFVLVQTLVPAILDILEAIVKILDNAMEYYLIHLVYALEKELVLHLIHVPVYLVTLASIVNLQHVSEQIVAIQLMYVLAMVLALDTIHVNAWQDTLETIVMSHNAIVY